MAVVCRPGVKDRNANEVLEGACKVMGGTPTLLVTAGSATRRKTPRSRSRDPRTQVEPQSQASGYVGSSDTEDQHNTAEGLDARDPGDNGGRPDGGNTATDPREYPGERASSDRDSKYSGRNTGDSRNLGWSVSLHPFFFSKRRPPPSFRVQLNPGNELAAFLRYSHRKAPTAPRDPSFGR